MKGNQPQLHQAIEEHTQLSSPVKIYNSTEKSRDRNTHRRFSVFTPPPNLDPSWIGVGCVIQVERFGTRSGVPSSSLSYYLSSLPPNSRKLADGIRGHWCIENRLHWVKDVIYLEDSSPQKSGFAPLNLSLLKSWVLTHLRALGYDSIKEATERIAHNLPLLLSFCT